LKKLQKNVVTNNRRDKRHFFRLAELGKRFYILFLFFFTVSANLDSQTVFIYDQQTGNPIHNVFVYNEQKTATALSNQIGIADISDFGNRDNIIFQHPSYEITKLSKLEISKLKFRVGLKQKLVSLSEVVVSANKWESDIREVPNQIEVIKSKDIVFENPQTSADMLAKENQVYVQKSQLGGGSPMLRGFAANRILLIIDGIRQNNAIYRSGNLQNILQADVNSIESAEVIFGPGTIIYGSDALGGVIDIHTLTPKITNDEKWSASGHGLARIASADFEKTIHADLDFSNNKWGFLFSISYSDFDDLKMGTRHNEYATRPEYVTRINGVDSIVENSKPNLQRFSGYNQLNFMTKIRQKFAEKNDWTFSLYMSKTGEVPRYDRLLQYKGDHPKYASWYYLPQQWIMNSLNMNFNNPTRVYDDARFIMAYQNVKEGRNDRKYRNEWLRKRNETVDIFSFNGDFDKSLKWNNFLFYGVEFVYNGVRSEGMKENINTGEQEKIVSRYPDGDNNYYQAGVYLNWKKNYTKTPLSLQAGIRYSYVSLHSTFIDTSFYHLPYDAITIRNGALTGGAGMTYRPGAWQFKFNLSSGFRAPNLDDVAKIFDSEPGNVVVPNENLKPEYLYNADVGIVYKYDDILNFEITAFYSYLKNAMVRRDFQLNGQDSIYYDGVLSKVEAVVNAGHATIYGSSLLLNIRIISNLAFNTTLTYIKGRDDEGNAMRHAPPLYGASTLTYELERLKLALSAVYNAEVSYVNLAPTERSKAYMYATDAQGNPYSPGWWTLNLKGSYAFNHSFLVTFGVENILDYRYRPYSSGITAPGINFIAAFRFSF